MSKWLYLPVLILTVGIALVICARVWGWPHVVMWAVLGAVAGGLSGFPLSKSRNPHA